jgi:hypothetical protein
LYLSILGMLGFDFFEAKKKVKQEERSRRYKKKKSRV